GANLANAATNLNTASTLVKRDGSGNFSAGTITAALNGNALSATTAASTTNFTGSLAGNVTGTQGATVVASVGGVSAGNVAGGATLANAATNLNTASAIVRRDASGNFSAGTITATFSGDGSALSNLNGANLSAGSVSYSKLLLTGSVTNADISGAAAIADTKLGTIAAAGKVSNSATTATDLNTANAIVARNATGGFVAGTITASLNGNADTATTAATVPDGTITTAKLEATLAASFTKFNPAPLEFVTVGNLTNSNDTIDGNNETGGNQFFGAVSTSFQMGKYEVTNDQYAEFLNAVAMTDPNGLYDPAMGNNANGGIIREGYSGRYVYVTKLGMRFKPVLFVKWHSAVRFCNWLTNSKPTGAQGNSTTETGAYTITGSGPNWSVAARTAGATKYYLPTENEWYKAAYHKNDGNTANYWLLPTKSNIMPNGTAGSQLTSISPADYNSSGLTGYPVTNCANFRYADANTGNKFNDGYATTGVDGVPNPIALYLTEVGLYSQTVSPFGSVGPYGTYDQGGNVGEWTEIAGINANTRVVRGGAWDSWFDTGNATLFALRANIRLSVLQSSAQNNIGFRVTFRP
ncbi:MAG: SUMF1/EgtB/PvdO family nonheme iron enzyme, partial [Chthoniobacteraceae bacterium]